MPFHTGRPADRKLKLFEPLRGTVVEVGALFLLGLAAYRCMYACTCASVAAVLPFSLGGCRLGPHPQPYPPFLPRPLPGMGPAPNLKLYARHVDEIIGVDCNAAMHGYARQAAEAAHAADKLRLITGRAEALPLEDGSADAVVMTHVRGWYLAHPLLQACTQAAMVVGAGHAFGRSICRDLQFQSAKPAAPTSSPPSSRLCRCCAQ